MPCVSVKQRNSGMKKGYKYPPEHKQWNKGIDNKIERVCESCGKTFKVYPSALKNNGHSGRFCSRQCYFDGCTHWAERTQILELSDRGKSWREIASIMGIKPKQVTDALRNAKVRGGKTLPSMGRHRLCTVLNEDYGVRSCEICGFDRITQIAHILEVNKGGRYYPDNCLLLCPNCHCLFDHNMLTDSERHKLLDINRLNGNLRRRFKKCLTVKTS